MAWKPRIIASNFLPFNFHIIPIASMPIDIHITAYFILAEKVRLKSGHEAE